MAPDEAIARLERIRTCIGVDKDVDAINLGIQALSTCILMQKQLDGEPPALVLDAKEADLISAMMMYVDSSTASYFFTSGDDVEMDVKDRAAFQDKLNKLGIQVDYLEEMALSDEEE